MSEDINVGAMSEALNNKVDLDMHNAQKPYVVSRSANSGGGGVTEIWSDGYCVQSGKLKTSAVREYFATITLDQPYLNKDNIRVFITPLSAIRSGDTKLWSSMSTARILSTSVIAIKFYGVGTSDLCEGMDWKAEGYIR